MDLTMCDECVPEPEELLDYCSCPLWEPCTCGAEAPITEGYADMQPWRVDREAEMRLRLSAHARLAARRSA
jgi:hypothetical protein